MAAITPSLHIKDARGPFNSTCQIGDQPAAERARVIESLWDQYGRRPTEREIADTLRDFHAFLSLRQTDRDAYYPGERTRTESPLTPSHQPSNERSRPKPPRRHRATLSWRTDTEDLSEAEEGER